jgi:outer membrane protein OmpA-like peptidoglycan-associated protein
MTFALLAAAAPAALAANEQPDLKSVKADFLPGEKTLFYDDFSDMAGEEPPPHWRVRGGSVALKVGGAVRQLTAGAERTRLTPNFKNLPRNFTLELEVKFDNPGDLRSIWYFHHTPDDEYALRLWTQSHGNGLVVKVGTLREEIGEKEIEVDFSQPLKQALWVQNGRLRFYVNGERVIDANQVELPSLSGAELEAELYGDNSTLGYRFVRFAESTPDFSQTISSTGRYITHGILFDTDSDVLKAESAAIIKAIARGLETNPALKLRIEGHTDSTGAAAHNLDLSKRRAEAVRAVLVGQFGVDAARLTSDGLGSAKPLDTNDTPRGRAQNRRVEFVKQ